MRLVCPNCEAKYEVPEDAIPDTGRDVQCASCGHSWFQMRPRPATATPEAAPVAEPAGDVAPEPVSLDSEAEPPVAKPSDDMAEAKTDDLIEAPATHDVHQADAASAEWEMTADSAAEPGSADTLIEGDSTGPEADAPKPPLDPEAEAEPAAKDPAPVAAAYAVDESVLAILREEAEREAQARRAEARPLESQPDLGLESAMAGRQAPALMATAGTLSDAERESALKPSARRDLLPDVEEINSTLRPSEIASEDESGQADPAQRESRGFRSGFLMVMTLAIIGAVLYVIAPRLSGMVPALDGPLEAYVGVVDGLRLSLDGMMRSATVAINGE